MFSALAAAWAQRLASQAEGPDVEGGVITPTFGGVGAVFHDVGKIRPYYAQTYPTTSVLE